MPGFPWPSRSIAPCPSRGCSFGGGASMGPLVAHAVHQAPQPVPGGRGWRGTFTSRSVVGPPMRDSRRSTAVVRQFADVGDHLAVVRHVEGAGGEAGERLPRRHRVRHPPQVRDVLRRPRPLPDLDRLLAPRLAGLVGQLAPAGVVLLHPRPLRVGADEVGLLLLLALLLRCPLVAGQGTLDVDPHPAVELGLGLLGADLPLLLQVSSRRSSSVRASLCRRCASWAYCAWALVNLGWFACSAASCTVASSRRSASARPWGSWCRPRRSSGRCGGPGRSPARCR